MCILVQNGIGTPVATQQQQKMIENLLAEQVVRNSTAHDKMGWFSEMNTLDLRSFDTKCSAIN